MLKKLLVVAVCVAMALALVPVSSVNSVKAQDDPITIAFVPGVNPDPFYVTMAAGVNQAAQDLGVEIIEQDPQEFNPTVQTPIIEAMAARGDVDFLITAPTDKQQLIPVLEGIRDAGIPLLTVDTFIGDGDYENGEVTFPISYIGSDNFEGGYIACETLAEKLGEGAQIYIQNVRPGISTTDQREQGCVKAAEDFGLEVIGVDYNEDDPNTGQQQTAARLESNPDLAGIFGANTFSAQAAGAAVQNAGLGGAVEVVAFDASEFAIELLREGTVTEVIAQKPYDMGYLAVSFAVAYLKGYQSVPKRVPTGYAVMTAENIDDPEIAQYIYTETPREPEPALEGYKVAFVPGVNPDPFYVTMSVGANEAADAYGIELIQQDPQEFNPTVQTPIIEALVSRGDINFMFTAPTDKQQMIPVLEAVRDAGIPLLTVDTFIGDGDYANGEVTFPLTYIGSDNFQGGYIACETLAEKLGEGAQIYIQNVRPGISTTDQREQGCVKAAEDYGLEVIGVDYNEDDPNTGQQQTAARLEANPDLAGVFGANTFSAQAAGAAVQNAGLGGAVEVVAFDASEFAIELLREGTVTEVIAQKPADMGYYAVLTAVANARGVVSVPKRIPTGYAVMTAENIDDPEISIFIYREQ
ncbi:ABC transporter substrate-binding protein [Aggregatilinea lenta]|uniref:ABC transporter substrate-binding protein n=1 Tax=Aggregatilinea lenta TaxID=913108 RepID=UPI000E5A8AA6|nr:ABC transporter substrate-binding protein [Aggregatilinea lenta]